LKDQGENLTQLLRRVSAGDEEAAAQVASAAYGELRKLAARCLRREALGAHSATHRSRARSLSEIGSEHARRVAQPRAILCGGRPIDAVDSGRLRA